MNAGTRRKLTNRSDRAQRHYQYGYGHRATSNWGDGDELSEYAAGDVVRIPASCPAFDRRIPHSWSRNPDQCQPDGLYRVTCVFSIGEGPEWYYRVVPILPDGETAWENTSDRLHVIPGVCDYTEGWELIESGAAATPGDE